MLSQEQLRIRQCEVVIVRYKNDLRKFKTADKLLRRLTVNVLSDVNFINEHNQLTCIH